MTADLVTADPVTAGPPGRYHGRMTAPEDRPRISTWGYAAGMGLAVMAIVGSFVHFAFAAAPDWAMFGAAFVAGGAVGAWRALAADVRHGTDRGQ